MSEPRTLAELQDAVRSSPRVRVRGGGSKDALSAGASLSSAGLSGVLEYEPQEYTFTALAGTRVAEVEGLLAEHGQYLPFDPPFVTAGATLGGTVAAGLSGPGRYRYGGVRDFLLAVTFVDGAGELRRGGAKVVKNAAGFDLPKLMVGSRGRFGVLAELTFKVFPRPEAFATLRLTYPGLPAALGGLQRLSASPLEPASVELSPPWTLYLRVGGRAEAIGHRLERLEALLGQAGEPLMGDADAALWAEARDFGWVGAGYGLVKAPLRLKDLDALEAALESPTDLPAEPHTDLPRRYGLGGSVLHLAWPETLSQDRLGALLEKLELSGLALRGRWQRPELGRAEDEALLRRLVSVLDPEGRCALGGVHAA